MKKENSRYLKLFLLILALEIMPLLLNGLFNLVVLRTLAGLISDTSKGIPDTYFLIGNISLWIYVLGAIIFLYKYMKNQRFIYPLFTSVVSFILSLIGCTVIALFAIGFGKGPGPAFSPLIDVIATTVLFTVIFGLFPSTLCLLQYLLAKVRRDK